jgi:hypothetical protein
MHKISSLLLLLACSLASIASAQNLYTATDGNGPGSLYRLALDGTPTLVGPLLDASNHAFSITGLAQFGNGPMYGVTANLSPTSPRNLVTVDLTTARVTVIGPLGLTSDSPVNDIVFLPNGTLFGFARAGQFATINTSTGAATLIGLLQPFYFPDSLAVSPVPLTFTTGGGGAQTLARLNLLNPKGAAQQITIPAGTVFATMNGPCGQLHTINPTTGVPTVVGNLTFGDCAFRINGLRFASNGTLYTLLTQFSDPFLATIGTNGLVSTIGNGSVPPQVGSLAFGTPITPPTSVPFVSSPVLLAMTLGLLLLGLLQFRRMQHS